MSARRSPGLLPRLPDRMTSPLQQELDLARRIARVAGKRATEIRRAGLDVNEKSDDEGPVTQADRAANTIICDALTDAFPDDRVVAEESHDGGPIGDGRVWFVDPIDGTREFIRGSHEWSVMIGLAIGGRAVLGVVHCPGQGATWWGRAELGSERMDRSGVRPIHTRTHTTLDGFTALMSRSHANRRMDDLMVALGAAALIPHGSVGLKASIIAEGHADVYMNLSGKTHLWDLCAADAILRGAGGRLATFQQRDVDYAVRDTRFDDHFLACRDDLIAPLLDRVSAHFATPRATE